MILAILAGTFVVILGCFAILVAIASTHNRRRGDR